MNAPAQMSEANARFHYMDNLRALAMLTGVVFHAALAYSVFAHPLATVSTSIRISKR